MEPPDSAPFLQYARMCLKRVRVFAAVQIDPILRIRPRKAHDLTGARLTARTRRVQAASRWYRSRTGMSLQSSRQIVRIRKVLIRDSSSERPLRLPAHLCGLRSPQASCSWCYSALMQSGCICAAGSVGWWHVRARIRSARGHAAVTTCLLRDYVSLSR